MRLFLVTLLVVIFSFSANAQWIKQSVNTTASFRGLSVVNEKVIWASGTGGTVVRTIDGGKKWDVIQVPDAAKLDFRDIEAFDANTAYILSIGNGESSRIYKTTDGGKNWNLQFKNTNEKAFFDAIACWDKNNCIAMSDPIDGKYVLVETTDGTNWRTPTTEHYAIALTDEAAFAASGTCLIATGKSTAFIVSGGTAARVFRSDDRGKMWLAANTSMTKGSSGSGIFSIAMFDAKNGVIVGGNYEKPVDAKDNLAFTTDGGKTWKPGTGLSGYRSAVAYVDKKTIIAVGTNGSDVSLDGGQIWKKISELDLNAVASRGGAANVWAVGPKGLVVKMNDEKKPETPIKATSSTYSGHAPLGNVNSVTMSKTEFEACVQGDVECIRNRMVNVAVSAVELKGMKNVYIVTGGKIIGTGSNVTWDLSSVKPGRYTITAAISQPYGSEMRVFGRTETRVVTVR